MRILIVEDNPDILANLYGFLEPLGYTLDCARDGLTGLHQAIECEYDAIVLDLMLPRLDGLEVCRRLRREMHQAIPILMLTARDTVDDKLLGFDSGADDYLIKPFAMAELDARLKVLTRRARGGFAGAVLSFGELRFEPESYEASRDGRRLKLTPTGYKLLGCLMRAAPRVVRRATLEREVWGDELPDSDALRTHMHELRQVLDKPFATPMLESMRSIGYRLTSADES